MAHKLEALFKQYDYSLPPDLIAQMPAEPRDSARLLVYDRTTDSTRHDAFSNLPQYVPKNAVLVFNQTKVLPARLPLWKATGGIVTVLYVKIIGDCIEVMANKPLEIGSQLTAPTSHEASRDRSNKNGASFEVIEKVDRYYLLKPLFPIADLFQVLEQFGETPIPPYIKDSPLSEKELRKKYQTVFAKEKGSVAAPTASLHFTNQLLKKLQRQGCAIEFVTLHVNLGTFAPLTKDQVDNGKLHEEWYEIDPRTANRLNQYKKEGRPIIAVGTTVVRTLESATNPPTSVILNEATRSEESSDFGFGNDVEDPSAPLQAIGSEAQARRDAKSGLLTVTGTTDLFIQEGFQFKFIDGMITNFHVPKSSLLLLVAAFTGKEKLFQLYTEAIKQGYKFFSFGDGMLLY